MELDCEMRVYKRARLENDHDHHHHDHQQQQHDHQQQQQTGMESLPREIVVDILSRLPITSLVQFKFVCKGWRALAEDPVLANLHLYAKPEEGNKKNPCLIVHYDSPIRNQLHFIDFSTQETGFGENEKKKEKKFHTPFQDRMPEFDVVGSCNGLLCLSDSLYNDAVYIYNPFTRDYWELPQSLQYPDQEVVFGFGFHPGTREYKVVKIVYYRKACSSNSSSNQRVRRVIYPRSDVQIYTLGSPAWRSLGKVSNGYQFVRRPSEALVNGRLHWVAKPRRYSPARRIVSLDIGDEQFREVPKPDSGGLNRCNFHLAVLGGCISAAVYGNYGKLEIWVMKKYDMKESWIKEYNIGAYIPKGIKQNPDRPSKLWKSAGNGRVVRVLCVLENGEILLEYKSRVLVSFDPKNGKFKDLVFKEVPNWFQTIVHQGSFNWIDTLHDKM